jgi:hypothetical protein
MKDSRYIELLNLYVDNQLTPGEAAELEAEVQRSPARRKLYAQYCRMHKACTLLFEADRELAPKTAAAVVAIRAAGSGGGTSPSERGWWLGWKGLGMAAAAAMAVMVGTRFLMTPDLAPSHDLAGADSLSIAAVDPVPVVGQLLEEPKIPTPFPSVGTSGPELQSVLFATAFRSSRDVEWSPRGEPNSDLAWLKEVRLPVLSTLRAEDLQFEVRSAPLGQPDSPVFAGRRSFQDNLEMTAFQFQR